MCLSVPGKVVEMREDGKCVVDYEAEKREAMIFGDDIEVGDYVVVSNKVVVMKVPKDQAADYLNAIRNC